MDSIQYIKDMLLALRSELLSHRTAVAGIFTAVLLLVTIVAVNWPKTYTSSAMIKKDNMNVIAPLLNGAAQVTGINRHEKVAEIIYSRSMLERILKRIDPDFDQLTPEDVGRALQALGKSLRVRSKSDSELTRVTYRADIAQKAYDTLNAIVSVFIEDRMADKQKKSHEAHDFISAQVDQYKERLLSAEKKLNLFKSTGVEDSELAVQTRITKLEAELQELKISIDEGSVKIRTLRTQLKAEGKNVTVRKKLYVLEGRRNLLSENLDQLRLIYQDTYPDIVTIKAQITEIEHTISELKLETSWAGGQGGDGGDGGAPLLGELRKQLAAAEVKTKTQKRRFKALNELLKGEDVTADKVASKKAQLVELTRDYDVTKNLYEQMLARRERAKLTLALDDEGQGIFYKLSEAPNYPLAADGIRALWIFLAAPFVAFCVPLGLAGAFIILDPRIRSRAALSQKIPPDVRLLISVPHRGTSLSARLLRKDIFLLLFLAVALMAGYAYALYYFKSSL